ncbi:hypothetical protein [Streptomyces sp. NRRL B-24484]|uniref:hypothetical protein n=1 Tax=Streptomyces sp. NRRL B-24484 TaxID=1463833 RepID=UPI0004C1EE83|nr:hypothetical protein [Streptomyces sp. NRRL B-24484]
MDVESLQVEELVDLAVHETVMSGDGATGRLLVSELERRGEGAVWQAALFLFGVLATRPVYGLPERAGVERLRQVARGTPDPLTALVLECLADHRDAGAVAAREPWRLAPSELQRAALLQLLISVCVAVGSDHGTLAPAQTVALVKDLIVGPAT